MIPLDALSLAAAVVQFVDFGAKLLVTGYTIYNAAEGAAPENIHIEKLTLDLKSLSDKLQTQPARKKDSTSGPGIRVGNDGTLVEVEHGDLSSNEDLTFDEEDETALQDLARTCSQLAQELLAVLEGLKVKSPGALRTWHAIRQAIRTACKKERIKSMQKRLDRVRAQLNSHLLAVVVNLQHHVSLSLEEFRRSGAEMHIANIKELEGLRNNLSVALRHQQSEIKFLAEAAKRSDEEHLIAIGICQRSLNELLAQAQQVSRQDEDVEKTNGILNSLKFAEMWNRQEDILEAYPDTFKWIYDNDTTPFQTWLEHGSGVFWINGKAGSGKSTLMKYLAYHKRTKELLSQWACQKRLVLASFYFCNSGFRTQKSQRGLLRSLLYQILGKCPELVPLVCPERWNTRHSSNLDVESWRRANLSTALKRVVAQQHLPARFCFFIDGLDEFEGEQDALIKDLEAISELRTTDIKICVSSRPWNVFRKAYGHQENLSLTLQDLTKSDMAQYIRGMLGNDDRFRRLCDNNQSGTKVLNELEDRAQGVFLWVFLVVRSLLRGLTEDDDMEDLMVRLRALPTDLNLYFRHILDSIDDTYRLQTAMALQMAHSAGPLPLLVFWYLPNYISNPKFSVDLEIQPISRTDVAITIREQATTFVNKWCKDLLEVHRAWNETTSQPFVGYNVVFLHRTVKDFLATQDIQTMLSQYAGHESVWHAMTSLHLARTKALLVRCQASGFTSIADDVILCAKLCEQHDQVTPFEILCELDKMGKHHIAERPGRPWTMALPHERKKTMGPAGTDNFMALAVRSGLFLFAKQALNQGLLKLNSDEKGGLLFNGLEYVEDDRNHHNYQAAFFALIRTLLDDGANVNTAIEESSPWKLLQQHLAGGHQWLWRLRQDFIQHGADTTIDSGRADPKFQVSTAQPQTSTPSTWRWPSWVEITNKLTPAELRDDDLDQWTTSLVNPIFT